MHVVVMSERGEARRCYVTRDAVDARRCRDAWLSEILDGDELAMAHYLGGCPTSLDNPVVCHRYLDDVTIVDGSDVSPWVYDAKAA